MGAPCPPSVSHLPCNLKSELNCADSDSRVPASTCWRRPPSRTGDHAGCSVAQSVASGARPWSGRRRQTKDCPVCRIGLPPGARLGSGPSGRFLVRDSVPPSRGASCHAGCACRGGSGGFDAHVAALAGDGRAHAQDRRIRSAIRRFKTKQTASSYIASRVPYLSSRTGGRTRKTGESQMLDLQ